MREPMKVAIARISRGCSERTETGTWLAACFVDPIVPANLIPALDVLDVEPTPLARIKAVMRAREAGYRAGDVLIMIDNDMVPPDDCTGVGDNWYNRAVRFFEDRPGPNVFASPYCGAAPKRDVQAVDINGVRYTRERAALCRHIDQVAGMGTGLMAFDMACFDVIEKAGLLPWFEYTYEDPPYNSRMSSTEDMVFCRKLNDAGGRIYCDWESWSGHAKVEIVRKPEAPANGAAARRKGVARA
jgi:hypothetical protein